MAWPRDAHAAALMAEWLADPQYTLNVVDADLRGADLSGATFESCYLNNADLRGVRMREIDLYRASLGGARLDGADLTGAILVRAGLDEVSLVNAVVDQARLGRASMINVDAREASFRDTDFGDAIVSNTDHRGVDFRGADLRGAVMKNASLKIRADETTRFEGMHGRFLGPFVLEVDGAEREPDGDELRSKGADVEIMVPKYPQRR